MPTVYLSLGSNLGDRAASLREALSRLDRDGIRVDAVSSIYETEPIGETSTPVPGYLNIAARIETGLPPENVLARLREAEEAGGRERSFRWSPRTIDVDLLLYDDLRIETEALTVPHPRMTRRAFVLVPLAEIAPDLVLPDGTPVRELVSDPHIRDQGVRLWSAGAGSRATMAPRDSNAEH